MRAILLTPLLFTGCSGLVLSPPVEVDHGAGVVWMDSKYERGQIPGDWLLGIRADGVVVAKENKGE